MPGAPNTKAPTDDFAQGNPASVRSVIERTNDEDPSIDREVLSVHTLNVRSLRGNMAKHALAAHLIQNQPDILVLTETWLNR